MAPARLCREPAEEEKKAEADGDDGEDAGGGGLTARTHGAALEEERGSGDGAGAAGTQNNASARAARAAPTTPAAPSRSARSACGRRCDTSKDVDVVMSQACVDRPKAIAALAASGGDLVDAIMALTYRAEAEVPGQRAGGRRGRRNRGPRWSYQSSTRAGRRSGGGHSDDDSDNDDDEEVTAHHAARPAPQGGYPLQQPRKVPATLKSPQSGLNLSFPTAAPPTGPPTLEQSLRLQAAEAALADRTPSPVIYQGCPAHWARSPTTLLAPLHPSYTGKVTPTHPLYPYHNAHPPPEYLCHLFDGSVRAHICSPPPEEGDEEGDDDVETDEGGTDAGGVGGEYGDDAGDDNGTTTTTTTSNTSTAPRRPRPHRYVTAADLVPLPPNVEQYLSDSDADDPTLRRFHLVTLDQDDRPWNNGPLPQRGFRDPNDPRQVRATEEERARRWVEKREREKREKREREEAAERRRREIEARQKAEREAKEAKEKEEPEPERKKTTGEEALGAIKRMEGFGRKSACAGTNARSSSEEENDDAVESVGGDDGSADGKPRATSTGRGGGGLPAAAPDAATFNLFVAGTTGRPISGPRLKTRVDSEEDDSSDSEESSDDSETSSDSSVSSDSSDSSDDDDDDDNEMDVPAMAQLAMPPPIPMGMHLPGLMVETDLMMGLGGILGGGLGFALGMPSANMAITNFQRRNSTSSTDTEDMYLNTTARERPSERIRYRRRRRRAARAASRSAGRADGGDGGVSDDSGDGPGDCPGEGDGGVGGGGHSTMPPPSPGRQRRKKRPVVLAPDGGPLPDYAEPAELYTKAVRRQLYVSNEIKIDWQTIRHRIAASPDEASEYTGHQVPNLLICFERRAPLPVIEALVYHDKKMPYHQDGSGDTALHYFCGGYDIPGQRKKCRDHFPRYVQHLCEQNPKLATLPNTAGVLPVHTSHDLECSSILIKAAPECIKFRSIFDGETALHSQCDYYVSERSDATLAEGGGNYFLDRDESPPIVRLLVEEGLNLTWNVLSDATVHNSPATSVPGYNRLALGGVMIKDKIHRSPFLLICQGINNKLTDDGRAKEIYCDKALHMLLSKLRTFAEASYVSSVYEASRRKQMQRFVETGGTEEEARNLPHKRITLEDVGSAPDDPPYILLHEVIRLRVPGRIVMHLMRNNDEEVKAVGRYGRKALHLAAEAGYNYDVLKAMADVDPEVVDQPDPLTGFLPFMLTSLSRTEFIETDSTNKDAERLTSVYQLLVKSPHSAEGLLGPSELRKSPSPVLGEQARLSEHE